jgi:signal transduction histidine kinase
MRAESEPCRAGCGNFRAAVESEQMRIDLQLVNFAHLVVVDNNHVARQLLHAVRSSSQIREDYFLFFRKDFKQRGMDVKNMPIPPDAFTETAQKRVRIGLIIGEIVKTQSLQAKPEQLRQRIASDLHDDIGSNLGNIALLSEIVAEQSMGETREDVQEIHRIAQQTADSMRDIVWLIQRPAVTAEDFVQRLRNIAARTLTSIEWNFTADGLRGVAALDTQRHLVLAFKEMLHNIRKHAEAKKVQISLSQSSRELTLDISDDGIGFDSSAAHEGQGLASLRQRAIKLGGKLRITTAPGKGTQLVLTAKL